MDTLLENKNFQKSIQIAVIVEVGSALLWFHIKCWDGGRYLILIFTL